MLSLRSIFLASTLAAGSLLLAAPGHAEMNKGMEQAVTVGQTGITAQTVASVAGSDEEDIFGDEDGI